MLSRLTLPPPHRLGLTLPSLSRSHRAQSLSVSSTAIEGTDFAPPPLSKRQKGGLVKEGSRHFPEPTLPLAQSHDGSPLKSFTLFLPHSIPASIATDASALASYTLATAATYLGLWALDKDMESVDVRLPDEYSRIIVQNESEFLSELLTLVFRSLEMSGVEFVKKFVVPTSSLSDVVTVLDALPNSNISVKNFFCPLALSHTTHTSADIAAISKAFTAVKFCTEVTLVSDSQELPAVLKEIRAATRRRKTDIKFTSLSESERESTSTTGLEYLREKETGDPVGETVSPHSLIASLNTSTGSTSSTSAGSYKTQVGSSVVGGVKRRNTATHKTDLKCAFTTDCSYAEDPQISSDNTYPSEVWDLQRLHERGVDGCGTTIAVLDSGINFSSPAFKNRVIAVKNFVADSIDDFDCVVDSDGHGSLCAGIAAGASFYCPINQGDPLSPCVNIPPGVAPGAKLIICKVVSTTTGDVDTNAFLKALKWLKELHVSGTKVDVVSISLASSYFSRERARAINDLISLGVIVVCCASNVGRMKMQPISFPARLGHVLCIGAHDNNGKPTSFSPVGRELDFLAPGDDIWGPGPGTKGPFSLDCGSGTSCSTPAVAGLICLILHDIRRRCEDEKGGTSAKVAGQPLMDYVTNVWVIRELLKFMSSSPGHHSEEIGYGTLSPYRLLDCSTEEMVRIVDEIVEDE